MPTAFIKPCRAGIEPCCCHLVAQRGDRVADFAVLRFSLRRLGEGLVQLVMIKYANYHAARAGAAAITVATDVVDQVNGGAW